MYARGSFIEGRLLFGIQFLGYSYGNSPGLIALLLQLKLSFFKLDKVGSHAHQRHNLAGHFLIFLDLIGLELLADVLFSNAVGRWVLV